MKKLMFAFACAASIVAMADGNFTGFEILSGTTGLGNRNDAGDLEAPYYFSYERASGSTDGSIIKKYGNPDCLPAFDYTKKIPAAFIADTANDNYLELSTEGGTLWRNFTTAGGVGDETAGGFEGEHMLGDPVSLSDLAVEGQTVYVDTLVQFTPTEDGTAPVVSDQDQMAIWLNVDSTNPDAPVTNLCVLAATADLGAAAKTTFTITNADVVPGRWYRLTVKAIDNIAVEDGATYWPGFMIYLDGKLLMSDTPTLDADTVALYSQTASLKVNTSDIVNGSVFLSLWVVPGSLQFPSTPSFTAVGFKGSGALDDLVVSTDVPNIFESTGGLDFILKWDANVSAVSYTIGGTEYPVENLAALTQSVTLEEGVTSVEIKATAKDWYTVTGGTGVTTIEQDGQEITVATGLAATPEAAGANKLAGVDTAAAKAWAEGKNLSIAAIEECEFAKNAFLMNTDLSAEPGLQITAIEEVEGGWQITVKGTKGDGQVTLDGINGVLKIKTAATLGALAEATSADFNVTVDSESGLATILVTGDNTNFMKATVEAAPLK